MTTTEWTTTEWAAKRETWLVFHRGKFVDAKAALVRTPAELGEDMPRGINWVALTDEQAADPTWDAVPCRWLDMPAAVLDARGTATLDGRALVAHGMRFYLDDRGRPIAGRKTPGPPDPEIVDEAALLAFAAQLGRAIEVTQRGSLRKAWAAPATGKVARE